MQRTINRQTFWWYITALTAFLIFPGYCLIIWILIGASVAIPLIPQVLLIALQAHTVIPLLWPLISGLFAIFDSVFLGVWMGLLLSCTNTFLITGIILSRRPRSPTYMHYHRITTKSTMISTIIVMMSAIFYQFGWTPESLTLGVIMALPIIVYTKWYTSYLYHLYINVT